MPKDQFRPRLSSKFLNLLKPENDEALKFEHELESEKLGLKKDLKTPNCTLSRPLIKWIEKSIAGSLEQGR